MMEPLHTGPGGGHGQFMIYCPICGRDAHYDPTHRCPQRTLDARDRTMKGDRDQAREPSLARRLRDGFQMMGDEG